MSECRQKEEHLDFPAPHLRALPLSLFPQIHFQDPEISRAALSGLAAYLRSQGKRSLERKENENERNVGLTTTRPFSFLAFQGKKLDLPPSCSLFLLPLSSPPLNMHPLLPVFPSPPRFFKKQESPCLPGSSSGSAPGKTARRKAPTTW